MYKKFAFVVLVLACAGHCVECETVNPFTEAAFKKIAAFLNPTYVKSQAMKQIEIAVASSPVDDKVKAQCIQQAQNQLNIDVLEASKRATAIKRKTTAYLKVSGEMADLFMVTTDEARKVVANAQKTCRVTQLSVACLQSTTSVRGQLLQIGREAMVAYKKIGANPKNMLRNLKDHTRNFENFVSNATKSIGEGLHACLSGNGATLAVSK